jgi:tetratricopeptide (TPR) repeat protein
MKKLKDFLMAIIIIAAVGSLVYFMYQRGIGKSNRELTKRMSELSPRGGPPETIDGLRQAIALYEDQIERNVKEGAQTGVYWKILGIRLTDRGMHNDALDALERAVYFNAEDPVIYYLTAVSAANVAKSKIGFTTSAETEKDRYFKLSENAYLRALQLDITYARAMYGLAVLYVFELDRPLDAITQLERYMQIQRSDVSAMFVLARAYYMTENYAKAVETYDRIVSVSKDKKVKEEALSNREIIMEIIYE